MSYRFADSLRAGSVRSRMFWSCSQAVSKTVWHIPVLCVQLKTTDDGRRNCPKHVEFYSKNQFEKLVHLVGFVTRIYHDALSHVRQSLEIKWKGVLYLHLVVKTEESWEIPHCCRYVGQDLKTRASRMWSRGLINRLGQEGWRTFRPLSPLDCVTTLTIIDIYWCATACLSKFCA